MNKGNAGAVALDGLKPREVRRRLDDLQRAFEQSWVLVATYLALPSAELREDLLWAARTVVEKVKTDQRSRALEVSAARVADAAWPTWRHAAAACSLCDRRDGRRGTAALAAV